MTQYVAKRRARRAQLSAEVEDMADTYNVFISWSGERSQKVGTAIYDWLPMVVQSAKPWMSEEDIEKGSRGLDEIAKALDVMSVGIICLTPENLERPWILFETGA